MTAAAIYKGYVRYSATDRLDQDRPLSIDAARIITNNAAYFVDHAGQTRIKWILSDSADERTPTIDSTIPVDEWVNLLGPMPIDVNLKGDGDGVYKFRIRVGGRNTAPASGDVQFRVTISNNDLLHVDTELGGANTASYTVTSATGTWLNDSPNIITVSAEQAEAAIIAEQSQDTSANTTSTLVCRLYCEVFGQTEHTNALPALWGLVVEEFWG